MEKIKKIKPIVKHIIVPTIDIWVQRATGLENLPKDKAFIIAPNHCSYIEHIIISRLVVLHLNRKIYFLAKKEHFESKFQRTWHKLWHKYLGYVKIDRSKGETALKKSLSFLKKGGIMVIYPEGTRSLTGKIQKGKTGVARLALWARVPVVPLGIRGTFEILPKGKTIPKLKKATFNFGKPLYFDKYYNKPITKRLLRTITYTLMREIARLSGQEYNF